MNDNILFGELKITKNKIKFKKDYMDGESKIIELNRRKVFDILMSYISIKENDTSWIKDEGMIFINDEYFKKVLDYMEFERGKNIEYYKNRLKYYKQIIFKLKKYMDEIKGLDE